MTYHRRTLTFLVAIALLILAPPSRPAAGEDKEAGSGIPLDVFARFERIPKGNPVFYCPPPEWAAAAHAIVVDETVHYLWARRKVGNYWVLMHSTAPVSHPDNPIFGPSPEPDAWDSDGILTPQVLEIGDFYYMLYAGMKGKEWQSGLARVRKPAGH